VWSTAGCVGLRPSACGLQPASCLIYSRLCGMSMCGLQLVYGRLRVVYGSRLVGPQPAGLQLRDLLHRRATAGAQLVHSWSTAGLQLVYSWSTAGLQLVYSWSTAGAQLVHSWSTAGLQLVYSWSTAGLQLVYSWCTAGAQLVYSWSTAVLQLFYSWSTAGLQLVYSWSTAGAQLHPGLQRFFSCSSQVLSGLQLQAPSGLQPLPTGSFRSTALLCSKYSVVLQPPAPAPEPPLSWHPLLP
jgi:hypothetical protein